jgi:hypothetical protein
LFPDIYGEDNQANIATPENAPSGFLGVAGASVNRSIRADNQAFEAIYKRWIDHGVSELYKSFPDAYRQYKSPQEMLIKWDLPKSVIGNDGNEINTEGFSMRSKRIRELGKMLDYAKTTEGRNDPNIIGLAKRAYGPDASRVAQEIEKRDPESGAGDHYDIVDRWIRESEARRTNDIKEYLNEVIPIIRKVNPQLKIMTPKEIQEAYDDQAKTAIEEHKEALSKATTTEAIAGALAGGVVGGALDPYNLAALLIPGGAVRLAPKVLTEILKSITVDMMQLKSREEFYDRIGQPLTGEDYLYQLLGSVGFGAAGGAGSYALRRRSLSVALATEPDKLTPKQLKLLRDAAYAYRVQESIPFLPGAARALNESRAYRSILRGINKLREGKPIDVRDVELTDVEIQASINKAKVTKPQSLEEQAVIEDLQELDGFKVTTGDTTEVANYSPQLGDEIGFVSKTDEGSILVDSNGEVVDIPNTPEFEQTRARLEGFQDGDEVVFRRDSGAPGAEEPGLAISRDPESIQKAKRRAIVNEKELAEETTPTKEVTQKDIYSDPVNTAALSQAPEPPPSPDEVFQRQKEFETYYESDDFENTIKQEFVDEINDADDIYFLEKNADGQYQYGKSKAKDLREKIESEERLVDAGLDCIKGAADE